MAFPKFFKTIFFLFIVINLFLLACSKENDKNTPTPIPKAQPVNDNKSGGVYKGAVVGSTGSFAVVLQEGVNKIYMTMDANTYELTTQAAITSGNAISSAVFSGSGISMTFSVDANGNNPVITNLSIPNHPNALAVIIKETSVNTVMVFEGRYTKNSGLPNDNCSGTINFVINGNSFISCYRENVISNPTSAGSFSGAYSGSQINATLGTTVVAVSIGSNQQSITGTITDVCSASVNCTRTM